MGSHAFELSCFSGNQQHSSFSELYKKKEIDVKYSILVTIEGFVFKNFLKN